MNKFLKLCVAGVVAMGVVSVAGAQAAGPQGGKKPEFRQGGGKGPGMRMRMQQEIFAKLNLTKDQKDKLAALQKKTQASMKSLMEANKGDREAMRDKAMPIMKAHHDGVMAILTPEQEKKYQELMKAAAEKMRAERQANGGAGKRVKKTPPPTA